MTSPRRLLVAVTLLVACGDDSSPVDTGRDSSVDAAGDSSVRDVGVEASQDSTADVVTSPDTGADSEVDAFVSCLDEGRVAGVRYAVGDRCNFCTCNEDGTTACTDRTCLDSSFSGCEYEGAMHIYGERFMSADGCNQCVCAASGLACTRRPTCPDALPALDASSSASSTNASSTSAGLLNVS